MSHVGWASAQHLTEGWRGEPRPTDFCGVFGLPRIVWRRRCVETTHPTGLINAKLLVAFVFDQFANLFSNKLCCPKRILVNFFSCNSPNVIAKLFNIIVAFSVMLKNFYATRAKFFAIAFYVKIEYFVFALNKYSKVKIIGSNLFLRDDNYGEIAFF